MERRILHVLSQRPSRTGSGVTLDSLVRLSAVRGWRQAALVGVPLAETEPQVGGLPPDAVHRITFADGHDSPAAGADLPFPVPGMSDVMPYASSVWSRVGAAELEAYRRAWSDRLRGIVASFDPHLVHTNHIWLVSGLARAAAADRPVVATCHATGLRQMELCPHLREEVVAGCRDLDRFFVLRRDHRRVLADTLDVPPERITVCGAGFRDDVFGPRGSAPREDDALLYVGKYSHAKGLPWLLDACERLASSRPGLRLHVAGAGSGPEADALRERMRGLAPLVRMHGQLDQAALADLMRRCRALVLPSFYEGVPLVLAEGAACGCRVVATALPGVVEQIVPALGPVLEVVDPPRLAGVDEPVAADLPAFTDRLTAALERSLARPAPASPPDLQAFTWSAVQRRVEDVWRELLD